MASKKTTATVELKVKWACPKCGCEANGHANGKYKNVCDQGRNCMGFICECEEDGDDPLHGVTLDRPCRNPICYCCGYGEDGKGKPFPQKPKGLMPWEKKALEAGWAMPSSRKKELGL